MVMAKMLLLNGDGKDVVTEMVLLLMAKMLLVNGDG